MATRTLVVGGTGGIGYAVACRIASEAHPSSAVIISGRNKPDNIPHANMEFRQLDASSMRAIKQYTDQLKASTEKLDLLVLSQGILTTAGRTETDEGIDRKMALHYYGRQLLIRELQPVLKDNAKVVTVLDGTAGNPDKLNWEDLDLKKTYGLAAAAKHCMTMTDAMVQHFAEQQKATGSGRRHYVHSFPGIVRTNIAQGLPWYLRPGAHVLSIAAGISSDDCAEYLVKGMNEATAAAEKEGRLFSFIDSRGKAVPNKPVWTDERLKKVVEHTWKVVDDALNTAA